MTLGPIESDEALIELRDELVVECGLGGTAATWMADIVRRSYKDGVLMPLAFMALGVAGEAAEVLAVFAAENTDYNGKPDREKLTNELGDCLWYIQAMVVHDDLGSEPCGALREVDGDRVKRFAPVVKLLNIAILAGKVVDRVKKTAWHGKPIDVQAIMSDLLELSVFLYALGEDYGIKFLEIANYNIDKLNKRYPGGFVEGGGVR